LKRAEIVALFLLAFLIPTTKAVAQANDGYRKGSIEWRIIGGGALPVDVSSARPDRRLSFGAVEIGRILTTRHGPGILAGQFGLSLQMMPIVVRGPEDFWGVGLTPVFVRWSFSGTSVVRPFADASVGLMFVDWSTPGPGRMSGNFNEQLGFGVRLGDARGPGFLLGYRFQHISNGRRARPSPGVDTHLLYAGVSFVK
jgi:Lipid A 3-O-deacylase (PagL)